jgi:hypothetical protein
VHRNLLAQQLARQHAVDDMPTQIVPIEIFSAERRDVCLANIDEKIAKAPTLGRVVG